MYKPHQMQSKSLKMLLVDSTGLARKYLQALNRLYQCRGTAYEIGYRYEDAITELETKAFINGETSLTLHDLGGSQKYIQLRKISYAQKNCYIVFCENSADVTTNPLLPELRAYHPNTPILVVGIKSPELDSSKINSLPADFARAAQLSYVECDLSSEEQILQVLSKAIKLSLDPKALQKFITDNNKIKNSSPPTLTVAKEELMARFSNNNKVNTTFFSLLPDDVTKSVMNIYLANTQAAEIRIKDIPLQAALADVGFFDPTMFKNDDRPENSEICSVM